MRISEQLARAVRLHLWPAYWTMTPVGRFGDHTHVVSDEHQPHAVVAPLAHQKIEDLRLDGDVEGGGRLVRDQEFWRQASAMAIMTRWLMPPESWWG